MKNPRLICVLIFTAVLTTPVIATEWQTIYSTDFSSDPGWTTNAPSEMYWDSGSYSYHVKSWDTGRQYAYTSVGSITGSFKLEYDVMVTGVDEKGDLRFGLVGPDMNMLVSATAHVNYARSDSEFGGCSAVAFCQSDSSRDEVGRFSYMLDCACHNALIYDSVAQTLSWKAVRCDDGMTVADFTLAGVDTFSGMDRLYTGSVGDPYYPGATGEGYIDNVVLSIPEPATLALLVLGGVGLRRRRSC
jgi:hypothetical protein